MGASWGRCSHGSTTELIMTERTNGSQTDQSEGCCFLCLAEFFYSIRDTQLSDLFYEEMRQTSTMMAACELSQGPSVMR